MSHRTAPAWWILLALGVSPALPQTQVDLRTQSKSVDFAQAPSTRPLKTGSVLPTSCTEGDLFFRTGVTPGTNLYGCTSTNQWSLQAGGSGGGGALPDMSGRTNQLLSTDGSIPLWRAITTGPSGALQLTHSAGDIALDIVTAIVPQNSAANTFTGLNTFDLGLQLAPMSAPGSPSNGRFWYDSALNKFRCRENGVTKDCIGAGGGGAVFSVFGRTGDVAAQDNDYAGTANTYAAGKKQTFQASATAAGANVACAALPSSPATGDVACDSADGNKLKQWNGSAWQAMGGSAVSSVFGRTGAVVATDNDYAGTANTYTAGKKQTFQASATTAGANVACAALPSSPATGDVACDSADGNKLKQWNGSAWQAMGGSGGRVLLAGIAAKCQSAVAGAGFSLPASNAPTPTCDADGQQAYLSFAAGTAQTIYDRIELPADWAGTLKLVLTAWSTGTAAPTINAALVCISTGATSSPSYGANQPVSLTVGASSARSRSSTTLTTSGCAATNALYFRLQITANTTALNVLTAALTE